MVDSETGRLVICLFGTFEARRGDAPLPRPRTRKGQWLLALLALRPGAAVERAWLAGILWPDSAEAAALTNLRSVLKDLRRTLGADAGRLRSPTTRTLDLASARLDVQDFDAAIARGDPDSLRQAVDLYRGPLLEDCREEWAFQERQAREEACLGALEALAAQALAGEDAATAERCLRRAVAVDPLRESAQRALMWVLASGGNYAAALLVYRELRQRLHREINAAPDAETAALYQQLRAEARQRAQAPSSTGAASASPMGPPGASLSPLLPAGETLTFLFTDIEGSVRHWEEQPEAMAAALARHDTLLRQAIEAQGGVVFKRVGDAFCAAFATAPEALAAALAGQRALAYAAGHPPEVPLRVRMALHTGVAEQREDDYFGPPLNRVSRLLETGHGGQILLSLATQELVRDHLPEESGLRDLGEYRLKDLTRPERVFQLLHPSLPAEFPPLRSLEAFAHNLPAQLTSFIGREESMAQVKQFLGTTRLLTLTGSGGCGKTRLALQVAADRLEEYADGVWLVELAALGDPTLVPQTVAAALGVREEPGRPLTATLTDYLRPKQVLLILDNCEHLLDACAQLVESLLRGCPSLRLLVSSREGLGIGGEQTYRVPSLALPDARHLPPLERLRDFEAVQLFADRARLSQSTFAVTPANAPSVAQVCQRLDGIPLAIELAAARVKALPVEKLNERLDDMFRLLTGGSRTVLPRQQTLRALIDWSYDLLSKSEGALLRRLSVFAGGWTLEAAEAVCSGEGVEEWEALDLLTSLVEKSLVLYEERGSEGRSRLLVTVRQYARDRLLEAGEAAAVRERHRDWFLALAEQAEPELECAHQREWLDRLEAEDDNLRAALGWSSAQGQPEAGLRLSGALGRFWHARGYWTEGREHLAGLLALPGAQPRTAVRAKALRGAGDLARAQGSYGAARAHYEESLTICRELGDKPGVAGSLRGLGHVAGIHQQDYVAARALLEEGLVICRELGDKTDIAYALGALGMVIRGQGDLRAARALLEECLAIRRELGDKTGIAWMLLILGEADQTAKDYRAAWALFEEGLAIFRELGDKEGIAWSLVRLGDVARVQGDCGAARALFEESLAILQELGNKHYIALNLEGLAAVVVAQAQFERAARLFGAVEGLREAMGAPLHPADRVEHDRSVAAVRSALGEEASAAAWREGRAMTLEQAINYALEETTDG